MGRMVTRAEPAKATVLTRQQVTRLLEALASSSPVSGLTHRFYRYPARFSPDFVAHAIDVFTQPGDYVLDPRRTRRFAKCSLLKTAQWALDCRAEIPTREQFLQRHRHDFAEMLGGMAEFGRRTGAVLGSPSEWLARYRRILVRNAAGLE